jgi:hypothetical protein
MSAAIGLAILILVPIVVWVAYYWLRSVFLALGATRAGKQPLDGIPPTRDGTTTAGLGRIPPTGGTGGASILKP